MPYKSNLAFQKSCGSENLCWAVWHFAWQLIFKHTYGMKSTWQWYSL